ncbi:MAG: Maf family protein [Verrucomicrobiales bacterium]|nr:Maf family protein [Verrucomicrobiales bacterium]
MILASTSPRRYDLMTAAGYTFTVVPADVEEHADDRPPSLPALTESNAALKALHVASDHPDELCVGADTLVYTGDTALGKPSDLDHAFAMLKMLVGKTHQVCTGVCFARTGQSPLDHRFHEITHVTFKPLTDGEIRHYLSAISPLDKAGAYAAQDHGHLIIDSTSGSYSNVVGLPMERLAAELAGLEMTP